MGVKGPDYLTTREVADMFSVSPDAVTRWAHQWEQTGEIRILRTPGRQYRFWAADIRALLATQADHPAGKGKD